MDAATDVTTQLAQFAFALRYEDLPREVIVNAKRSMLDLMGVALLGSSLESTQMMLKACGQATSGGSATILGNEQRADAAVAALVNGFAAHALDYDDTQHNCTTHMSAPVLGALFGLAESLHCSGRELLTAYVAGFEIGCRLGRVRRFGRHLQRRGLHPTSVLGRFGALSAAGRLVGLDPIGIVRGLGIAATQASGITRAFGTMCKPLNAANAARDAVVAARLAKQGFTGPERIFEDADNLFSVYGGETDVTELTRNLGVDFEMSHNTIKIYACAGWRNPIVEAATALATEHTLRPSDIHAVKIGVGAERMGSTNYPNPRTGLEAKFSAEYAVAVGLIDRAGGMKQFSDMRVADPEVAAVRSRVTLEMHPDLGSYQIRVAVNTSDGRELSRFVPVQKGDPRNPLTWEEVLGKFQDNAAVVLSAQRIEQTAQMVQEIDGVADCAELMRLCSPGTRNRL